MKKHFMYYVSAFVLCMLSVVLLGACGKKDYDMSNISLSDATFTYDGNAHTIELKGELPNGVTADYKYYSDATYETEVTSPVDAGKYYVVVKFTGDAKHNPIEDKTATLTINKAVYPNLDVTLRATYLDDDNQEKTVMAKDNGDGTLYLESINKEYTISVNSTTPNGTVTTEFYNELNADGTVKESSKSLSNKLTNYGDKVHIKITLSDENHEPISVVRTITIERKTVEIRTYEDLENMNKDLFTKSIEERVNLRYLLLNDIDCEGKVWKTIGVNFGQDYFVSEFNGNGHTISNFKLTEQSVVYTLEVNGETKTVTPNTPNQCVHLGFFGYIASAEIHDVTFDNVNVKFDMRALMLSDDNSRYTYYGTVFARAEYDPSFAAGSISSCTSIYNVTVKNSNIDIKAAKAYIGGIIGIEHNKNTNESTFLRKNLKVEDVNMNVSLCHWSKKFLNSNESYDRISIGGIVGETQSGDVVVYEDCKVINLNVVGKGYYDVLYNESTGAFINTVSAMNGGGYGTNKPLSVGGILGWNRSGAKEITLKNCEVTNLTAALYVKSKAHAQFNGLYGENSVQGNRQDSNGADIVDGEGNPIPALYEENCTFTGTTGIYILGGKLKEGVTPSEDNANIALGDNAGFVYTPDKYDPNYVYVNGVLVTE
ncbi:MAG TPA: hypothetical protein DD621_02390 [Clostridiales bacterium]|nr:hypothetical protein [Clostridiales bacterium]